MPVDLSILRQFEHVDRSQLCTVVADNRVRLGALEGQAIQGSRDPETRQRCISQEWIKSALSNGAPGGNAKFGLLFMLFVVPQLPPSI